MGTFAPLSAEDSAALDSDREFAASVLEIRYPGTRLTGTPGDVRVLQQILDGGPYTDSAEAELIALGTSVGNLLGRALDMAWVRYTDDSGTDIGLRYGETSIVVFPRDMVVKRVENGEDPDIRHLYEEVVQEVKNLIASGQYR